MNNQNELTGLKSTFAVQWRAHCAVTVNNWSNCAVTANNWSNLKQFYNIIPPTSARIDAIGLKKPG